VQHKSVTHSRLNRTVWLR